jgi:hypothetical protein
LFWTSSRFWPVRLWSRTLVPSFYRDSLTPIVRASGPFVNLLNTLAPALALSVIDLFELISSSVGDLVSKMSSALISSVTSPSQIPMFLIGFVFMLVSSFYIGWITRT